MQRNWKLTLCIYLLAFNINKIYQDVVWWFDLNLAGFYETNENDWGTKQKYDKILELNLNECWNACKYCVKFSLGNCIHIIHNFYTY